jgi:hypothetical protein
MLFANNISYATVTKSSKTGSIAKAQKVPQIYFNNGLLKSSKKSFIKTINYIFL